jgi:site-specific DNA-methyltransferase (adenine-specific)
METNKIYQGDCLELMKQIEDNFIDLTVTSPPYDNLREYKGYVFNFEDIAKELFRITKEGGVVVWVVGDATIKGSETGTSFKQALYFKEIGFNLHDTMIYQKFGCPFPETNRYYPAFEYMFVLSKGKPKTTNLIRDRKNKTAGGTFGRTERQKDGSLRLRSAFKLGRDAKIKEQGVRWNVWQYQGQTIKGHPAPFPEKLAEDHIKSWSNEGDLVFDPFAGSGTTCKMALLNKRNYLGFEISQEYVDIANKRLEQSKLKVMEVKQEAMQSEARHSSQA